MLSLAHQLVARATRRVAAFILAGDPVLWTVSTQGRVVGSLMHQAGSWRLAWFDDADHRLVAYAGPVDGDVEALAEALGRRLGAPVRLQSQSF